MTRQQLSKRVDDFIKKYSGKTKGYPIDSSFNGECLSIVKLYIQEVFGINAPPSGSNSAYGYWANFPSPLPTIFNKVQNTLMGVPRKGDIPIWNTSAGGGFGHIAIFTSGDVNAFTSFDQNWNGRQAHLQPHDYTNIVGWLEPKLDKNATIPPEEDMPINDQTLIHIGGDFGILEVQAIRSLLSDMKRDLDNTKKELQEIKNEIDLIYKDHV